MNRKEDNREKAVTYFFRHPKVGYSIAKVSQTFIGEVAKTLSIESFTVPAHKADPISVIRNIWYVYRHRNKTGINHITGDIHYCAIALIGCKSVLTIHDLRTIHYVENPVKRKIFELLWFKIPLHIVNKVVCISEHTKNNLMKITNRSDIEVIYNAVDPLFQFAPKEFDKKKPVVLHIGTEWNKNLLNVALALSSIPCHLCIVGKLSSEQKEALTINHIDYSVTSDLTNEEIVEEYRNCDIVSFPSLYEGFGMPIIEAQTVGRAVLTSNIEPMREVAGNGAVLVNPQDINEIRQGILSIIRDDYFRTTIIQNGFENVKLFSPEKAAQKYIELYKMESLVKTLLQIVVAGNLGSVGAIADQIGRITIKNGWKSYIAFGRFPRPSESKLIRIDSKWSILLHVLQTRLFDRHGLGSRRATKKLIKQIKDVQPDVIHLHGIHGYYINVKLLFDFLKTVDIPIVWTLHDCWSFTGHCGNFDYVRCEKWKILCEHCPQKKQYPKSWFLDRSKKNFLQKKQWFTSVKNLTITTVSDWLKNQVKHSFLKNYLVTIVNNGVDISTFSLQTNTKNIQDKYNIPDKFKILGVANIWDKRKGLNDFIKLHQLLDAGSNQIILVGLSKKQISKLPKGIIGIERTENLHELAQLYSLADVYISTSVEETFGLTIVESMSCGTPVIVYNTTACPELVTPETGVAVAKNDINAVFNAISIIRQNGKQFYSKNCIDRVVENYDKDKNFVKYFDLYQTLIADKN